MSIYERLPDSDSLPPAIIEAPQEQCGFCLIPRTGTTDHFQRIHGDIPHTLRIPGMPAGWTVLQDVIPLAELGGQLIIMPDRHWISLATVDDQKGLVAATDAVVSGLRGVFPHPIFYFEHGPGFIEGEQIACGGCHMDHAHGHLLLLPEGTTLKPIQEHTEQILEYYGWTDIPNKRVESTTVFTDNDRVAGLRPYIHLGMIRDNDTHSVTYVQTSIDDAVESQLMRRVIAEVVYHHTEPAYWHWRDLAINLANPQRIAQLQHDVIAFREATGY